MHFEKGDYEEAIKDCDAAVEKGRELRADYALVARALARKGNALAKLGRLEDAVTAYNKSLTEHRTADTLKRLNETEKALKVRFRFVCMFDFCLSGQCFAVRLCTHCVWWCTHSVSCMSTCILHLQASAGCKCGTQCNSKTSAFWGAYITSTGPALVPGRPASYIACVHLPKGLAQPGSMRCPLEVMSQGHYMLSAHNAARCTGA